jgi:hypothetical protein
MFALHGTSWYSVAPRCTSTLYTVVVHTGTPLHHIVPVRRTRWYSVASPCTSTSLTVVVHTGSTPLHHVVPVHPTLHLVHSGTYWYSIVSDMHGTYWYTVAPCCTSTWYHVHAVVDHATVQDTSSVPHGTYEYLYNQQRCIVVPDSFLRRMVHTGTTVVLRCTTWSPVSPPCCTRNRYMVHQRIKAQFPCDCSTKRSWKRVLPPDTKTKNFRLQQQETPQAPRTTQQHKRTPSRTKTTFLP